MRLEVKCTAEENFWGMMLLRAGHEHVSSYSPPVAQGCLSIPVGTPKKISAGLHFTFLYPGETFVFLPDLPLRTEFYAEARV